MAIVQENRNRIPEPRRCHDEVERMISIYVDGLYLKAPHRGCELDQVLAARGEAKLNRIRGRAEAACTDLYAG